MQQPTKRSTAVVASVVGVMLFARAPAASDQSSRAAHVRYPLQFSVSPPVRDSPRAPHRSEAPHEMPLHKLPRGRVSQRVADTVLQTSTPTVAAAQALGQWEGLGEGYPGYSVNALPPDPNIAVGPNHIVEWVNHAFVVFDKQGGQIQAPVDDATFWETSNCNQLGGFGDPIVQYDRAADRWLVGEVALPLALGSIGQFAQCIAVSTTPDPTGSYYMWTYGFGTSLNDYPKIGVWPDGYYITWNIFQNAQTFVGPQACAFNRTAMLSGAPAPALVCFNLPTLFASLLPSDLDGAAPPPINSPNFFMNVDPFSSTMNLWKFHVDFTNPRNSSFSGPMSVTGLAPFTAACLAVPDCIPQPGTTTKLDALGDRLMYRLAYRNFGDHESIVANHTVLAADGNTAVRWYEVRSPAGQPIVYQQGTFAPDTDNRWMASIAMDRTGNIGIDYSIASSSTYPSIRFTGWETGNPLGVLQAETFAVTGAGSQNRYGRWGDYSSMRIDPSDDCTFWFVQEYQAATQTVNWNTRIVSFQFPSCVHSLAGTITTLDSFPNPSTSGETVTFTATVSPPDATGSVQFFDGSITLGTTPVSGGSASLSTSTLSIGNHSITASYSGDVTYNSSSSSVVVQTVGTIPIDTTTLLTTSINPSAYGQAVILIAIVEASSGTPTGSVTFFDGSTTLGSSSLDASGVAALSISTLAVGTHSITARYGGDSTYNGSNASTIVQTVNKASTTTTLTSNRNPSSYGQSVTFTAIVASDSTPTGLMRFFDGSTVIGTVALNYSRASLTTWSLSVGTHYITARYIGDGNFNGSTSAVLAQSVRRKR